MKCWWTYSNHYFGSKLRTKVLLSRGTDTPKESEEEDSRNEDHRHEQIREVDVNPHAPIDWNIVVQDAARQTSNRISTHGQRNESQLKENRVHGAEFQGWSNSFEPVVWSSQLYGRALFVEFDQEEVSCSNGDEVRS